MRRHRLHRPPRGRTPGRSERPAPSLETCVIVCPICNGPMTPRYGRAGPYFHCLCYEPPAGAPDRPVIPAPGPLSVTG